MRSTLFALALGIASVKANLITNPGFENGDLSGWTVTGGDGRHDWALASRYGVSAHAGSYAAAAGSTVVTSPDVLSQVTEAEAGRCYTVSFWAQNPSGAVNSALYATFGSSLQPVNLAQDWTFYTKNARACGNDKFSVVSYNVPAFNGVDDISIELAATDDCTNSCATPSYAPTTRRLAARRSEHVKHLLRRYEETQQQQQ